MNNSYLGAQGAPVAGALLGPALLVEVKMGIEPRLGQAGRGVRRKGMRVDDKGELVGAFKEALAEDGPVLVDVRVTQEENCYPMIPAGQARARTWWAERG